MIWIRLAIRGLLRNRRFALFFILNFSIGLVGFIALNSFNYSIRNYLRSNLKEILTADLAVYSPRQLNEREVETIEKVLGPDKQESRQVTFLSMISGKDASRLARVIAVDNEFPLYGSMVLEKNNLDRSSNHSKNFVPDIDTDIDTDIDMDIGTDIDMDIGTDINMDIGTDHSSKGINASSPLTWITRDLSITLNVKPGDTVRIGTMDFVVDDIVISSPGSSITSVEFAPRIYIGISKLKQTGLTGFGSRIRYARYYRFPSTTGISRTITDTGRAITDIGRKTMDVSSKTTALRGQINALFEGEPSVSVYDSEDVNSNLGKLFGYFTGYMGLVSIVALFLAGIGTAYLFRGYLNASLKQIAILMTLGAGRMETYMMLLCQVLILGLISTLLSVLLSFGVLPLFPKVLQGLIPHNFQTVVNPGGLILASFLGTLGSVIFCLPVFVRVYSLKPVVLLQGLDRLQDPRGLSFPNRDTSNLSLSLSFAGKLFVTVKKLFLTKNLLQFFSFFPAGITFWLLAVGQTHSFERGTIFFLGFLGIMVIMALIGRGLLALAKQFSHTPRVIRKIAFRNLYRHKLSSISCFVTIAMGAFLINVIPQIKNGIQDEISRPQGLKVPGFFLIDIQPEQLLPLREFLEAGGVQLTNASPMVRGRITSVNGMGFYERLNKKEGGQREVHGQKEGQGEVHGQKEGQGEVHGQKKRQREAQRTQGEGRGRFRRREFNFSWREKLDTSETIVKGVPLSETPWDFESNTPMDISLEEGFADRFHLRIGDLMSFDIQGIPLEGRVVNLRKVRWNSFQPNFFILFQKGVLDDAPRTYLASIPQMPSSEKMPIQNALIKAFPNISVLDVNQTVKQLLNITDRLTFSINFMAWLAILAGLVVLFSIVRYETHGRSWEINLLKVLGAGFSDIRRIILFEFGFLGFAAAFSAVCLSLVLSYGISWLFFERLWAFRWEYSLISIGSITLICIVTALLATGRVILQKPVVLLKSA